MADLATALRTTLRLAEPTPTAFGRSDRREAEGVVRERVEYRGLEGDTIPAVLVRPP